MSSGLISYIINPGIIYNKVDNRNKDNSISNIDNKILCVHCGFKYPNLNLPLEHCDDCGVCIFEKDHHCGIIGKCIAKNNYISFMLFVISMFLLICISCGNIVYIIASIDLQK